MSNIHEHPLLILGSLLHDIGKLVQRASGSKERYDLLGEKYLDGIFKDIKGFDIIPLFARYHTSELKNFGRERRIKNLLEIVCEADNISATERYEGEVFWNPLFKSIFPSSLKLKGDGKVLESEALYYTPSEISPEKSLVILERYTSFVPSKMSIENDVSLFDHLKTTAGWKFLPTAPKH